MHTSPMDTLILLPTVKGRPPMGLSGAGALSPKSQVLFGADLEGPAEVAGTTGVMGTVGVWMVMVS
jgi:hypothetical protein